MTYKVADRLYETSTTTGTGTYTLDGAVTGFQAFSTLSANNDCPYFATDDTNWEVGIGTVLTGPNRLQRTAILASSNAGAAVNWGAGTRKIRCGLPSAFGIPRIKTKSVAGAADVTLTSDEQRCDILLLTGAITANISVIADATPWAWANVYNGTTGAFTLTMKVTGQTGVPILQGRRLPLHCDGTDVRTVLDVASELAQPPRNINPNWLIDQINEGALYTVNTTGVQGPDGWTGDAVGAGVFKLRTLADPDNAALKCMEISCTTADASIAATDRYEVYTAIEGYDCADLKIGTAAAAQITVQFKLKSNAVTGVFGVFLANSAGDRFYAGTITVPDTSEHDYNLSTTLDATGTWLRTNGIGLKLGLVLAAGSNFQGTAGAWTGSTVHTTASQANFMSVNTNLIYLKRIHVIASSVPLPYYPQDIQHELAKAQRQYVKSYNQGVAPGTVTGNGQFHFVSHASTHYAQILFPVHMRATPTPTYYSPTGASGNWRDLSTPADRAAAANGQGCSGMGVELTGLSTGAVHAGHWTANARLS